MAGFADIPNNPAFTLSDARVPTGLIDGFSGAGEEGLSRVDISISRGRIKAIGATGSLGEGPIVDMRGGQVWPCFIDMHTHLDKGHIWPRRPNPDGTFEGALEATEGDRSKNWSAADVEARMDFALRAAYAHGTKLVRTHLDSRPPQQAISWPVFAKVRDRWAGRIALQAVSLVTPDVCVDEAAFGLVVEQIIAHGGVLGAVTFMSPDLDAAIEVLFDTAREKGLDLDLHVDETADPAAHSLRLIAEAALRHKFEGRINVGHCCSLALQGEKEANQTIALVKAAGISVVSLPMCNLYLQDREAGRTPRWRGVTLIRELAAAGVVVAVASDNTRDPFYAYGDLDPVEVIREAVRILHLDHPIEGAAAMVTSNPAGIVGRPDLGRIRVGDPADLVLFSARGWTEFLARPQGDRIVLRDGKAIDRTLPDFRELDTLLGVG